MGRFGRIFRGTLPDKDPDDEGRLPSWDNVEDLADGLTSVETLEE